MTRRSTVYSLSENTRDDIFAKWRSGQYSLDQLAELAGGKVSRSALYRYLFTEDQFYKEHRLLQNAANTWCAKLGEDPGGNIGRLCQEMLGVLAHSQIRRLHGEADSQVDLGDLARLARTLRDLETASSISTAREVKLRELIAGKLDNQIEKARARGLDPAMLERAKILVRGRLDDVSDSHAEPSANDSDLQNDTDQQSAISSEAGFSPLKSS